MMYLTRFTVLGIIWAAVAIVTDIILDITAWHGPTKTSDKIEKFLLFITIGPGILFVVYWTIRAIIE